MLNLRENVFEQHKKTHSVLSHIFHYGCLLHVFISHYFSPFAADEQSLKSPHEPSHGDHTTLSQASLSNPYNSCMFSVYFFYQENQHIKVTLEKSSVWFIDVLLLALSSSMCVVLGCVVASAKLLRKDRRALLPCLSSGLCREFSTPPQRVKGMKNE